MDYITRLKLTCLNCFCWCFNLNGICSLVFTDFGSWFDGEKVEISYFHYGSVDIVGFQKLIYSLGAPSLIKNPLFMWKIYWIFPKARAFYCGHSVIPLNLFDQLDKRPVSKEQIGFLNCLLDLDT